jgi:competence protein ComEA
VSSPEPFPPRPPVGGAHAWRELLAERAHDPRWRTGALLVLAAVVGLVWYQAGRTSTSGALDAATPRMRAAPTTTTTRPPLLVHVAGAVARPGLVEVAAGDRVADAIAAAGGGLPDSDLDRLNLAAPVADGQRIPVARVGEPVGGADPAAPGGDAGGSGAPAGPIDLNTATAEQLDTLPGIGPTLAAAILRERERRGGFTDVGQLRDVRGIGEARYADIRELVTV